MINLLSLKKEIFGLNGLIKNRQVTHVKLYALMPKKTFVLIKT